MTESADGLLGRAPELAALDAAVDDARRGRPRFVLVTGEAGIGKTTLASELARRAASRTRVAVARAWEGAGAPALHLWTEALRLLGVSFACPVSMAADDTRFAAIDKIAGAVRARSGDEALSIVLDDLQWADAASLLALRLLVRSLRDERVLVVATLRVPHDVPAAVAELLADVRREATVIALKGLDEDELATLARARGIGAASAGAVLHRATAGNPLYAAEMLLDDEARAALEGGRPPPTPPALGVVLERHLARLDARDRALLAAAALGPPAVEPPLVATACAASFDDAVAALESARRSGVLVRAGDGAYRFSHDLLRAAARESIPPATAPELHRGWAQALSTCGEQHLLEIVDHAFSADPSGTSLGAATAAVDAARWAMRRLSYEDAVASLLRAANAHERAGRRAPLASTLSLLADAQYAAGDVAAAAQTAERALACAQELSEPRLVARAALAVGRRQLLGRGDPQLAAILEQALAGLDVDAVSSKAASSAGGGAEEREARALRAGVEARLACALQPEIDPPRAVELARAAIVRARESGDRDLTARILHAARPAFRILEDLDERIAMDAELLDLAGALGDDVLAMHAHVRLLHEAVEAGDGELADAHLADYERLAEEVRLTDHLVGAASARIMRASMRGDTTAAEAGIAELEATRTQWEPRLGARWPVDPVATLRIGLAAATRLPEAYDALLAEARLGLSPAPVRRSFEAFFAARAGRQDDARAAYELIAQTVLDGAPSFLLRVQLAEACIFLRDEARAGRLYDALLPFAGRHVVWTPFCVYDGAVDRLLGGLAAVLGDRDAAVGHLDRAARAEERVGARPFAARTRRARDELASPASPASPGSRPAPAHGTPVIQASPRTCVDTHIRLVQEGETWLVTFDAESVRLKDADGLHYLAMLVGRPNAPVTAIELFMARAPGGAAVAPPTGDAGDVLDARAIEAYRTRARDVRRSIDDATARNDLGLAEACRRELSFLESELSRAVGLGGRPRRASSDAERTRVNVTTRIRKVIEKLRLAAPRTADHLARSIRTGTTCVYAPPAAPAPLASPG